MPPNAPGIRQAYQKVAYSRATELLNSKDYSGAITLFDESLKNPSDPSIQAAAYFWKEELYTILTNYDAAV
jgi:TolA-binding protein